MIFFNFRILIFLLLFSCHSTPKHVQLADRAILSFSKEVLNTNELILVGSGGALFEDIKGFDIALLSYQRLKLNEARKLFINIAERFLYKINNDKEIRPYLHNYPITIQNLHLSISFYSDNFRAPPNYIAFITLPNIDPDKSTDRIYYCTYDHEAEELVDVYNETYKEALTKICN